MPFIKQPNQNFKLENNQIVLDKAYFQANQAKFKKITGSRFASILNLNKYSSPVKTWAMMVGIYSEPMDETVALVGNTIEPMIRDYVSQTMHLNFISYDPSKIKWDMFKENKIFGGIPDGEPVHENGRLAYDMGAPMLEIKTTSIDSFVYQNIDNKLTLINDENNLPKIKVKNGKRDTWFDSNQNVLIPTEYKFQLGLYCYLRQITKGIFAVAFLKPEDYAHPAKTNIYEREIKIVDFQVDLVQFQTYIDQATQWYNDFIKTGISPVLSQQDLMWYEQELKLYNEKNHLS